MTRSVDRVRLLAVLFSLLTLTSAAGAVDTLKDAPPGPTAMQGQTLVFEVRDTGKGIAQEELATILDAYRQVKGQSDSAVQKGTGLGLSITRKFAELLGGEVGVESAVGKGTTFSVRIPAEYEAA